MAKYGYIRVSTIDQKVNHSLGNQKECLIKIGVPTENIFQDVGSAKNLEREGLQKLMATVRRGDEIFVQRLDRLARNTVETLRLIEMWDRDGISLSLPDMKLSGTSPYAKIYTTLYALFAELETNQREERQREGIARAKELKLYTGRKTVITKKLEMKVKEMLERKYTKADMASITGVSRNTIYKIINKLKSEV